MLSRLKQAGRGALVAFLPLMAVPAMACSLADAQPNPTPVYPVDELWRLSTHTVTVLLEADGCGLPVSAELEASSGIPALDAQALAVAKAWVIPPDWRGRPRYRLPFDFNALPEPLPAQVGLRPRDAFFEERRSGHVALAEVAASDDAAGLPGYLHDPYPIGFFTLQEALATLGRAAVVKRYDGVMDFWLRDEEGLSLFQWYGHLLVRNRQVQQGGRQFVVSSALCGNDLEACRQRLGQLQAARGRQFPQPVAAAN